MFPTATGIPRPAPIQGGAEIWRGGGGRGIPTVLVVFPWPGAGPTNSGGSLSRRDFITSKISRGINVVILAF